MKTRTALTAVFASLAAALIGWQFSAVPSSTDTPQATSGGTSTNQLASPTSPGSPNLTTPLPSTTSPTAPKSSGPRDGTATGQSVNTQYGSVQVEVVVASGSISDVIAVHLTDRGGESVQISNYAAPILRGEVLQSQSAQVSSVSGATYTSEAYLSSLQSALDQLTQ